MALTFRNMAGFLKRRGGRCYKTEIAQSTDTGRLRLLSIYTSLSFLSSYLTSDKLQGLAGVQIVVFCHRRDNWLFFKIELIFFRLEKYVALSYLIFH